MKVCPLAAVSILPVLAAAAPRAGDPAPPAYHLGAPLSPVPDPLDAPVASYRAVRIPVASAFLSLSRSYGVTFVLDPAMKGDVTLEMRDGTVRDAIDALAKSQGFYWEREGRLIALHRNVVRFYQIDYPQNSALGPGKQQCRPVAQASRRRGRGPR